MRGVKLGKPGMAGAVSLLVTVSCLAVWIGMNPSGMAFSADAVRRHSERFLEGVKAYEAGEYEQAEEHFEALASDGVRNGKLYYNLGNVYLKQEDLGRAVLWYERARRLLGPGDPDLEFNLQVVRGLTVDAPEPPGVDWSEVFLFWRAAIPPSAWLGAGLVAYVAFWGVLAVRRWRDGDALRRAGWACGLLAGMLLLTFGYHRYENRVDDRAVILPAEVAVRSGTHPTTTELFRLHAGAVVQVDRRQEEYFRIRFGERAIGWVPRDAVERIAAAPPGQDRPAGIQR